MVLSRIISHQPAHQRLLCSSNQRAEGQLTDSAWKSLTHTVSEPGPDFVTSRPRNVLFCVFTATTHAAVLSVKTAQSPMPRSRLELPRGDPDALLKGTLMLRMGTTQCPYEPPLLFYRTTKSGMIRHTHSLSNLSCLKLGILDNYLSSPLTHCDNYTFINSNA